MHLKILSVVFFLISYVLFFPACIKYYKIAKEETNQGTNLPDHHKTVFDNERDVTVYDQFETDAIFNTLRLSDDIRKAYVDMNCLRRGKDEQAKQALLRRQLEENKHWLTFYVLADIRDKHSVSLTDKNSLWSTYLELSDGQKVNPISIKGIEFEPEYQAMFAYRFNLFKRCYEVKFPITSPTGVSYIQKNDYKLFFSSPKKACSVRWDDGVGVYREGKRKYKDEDFYWV